MELYDLDDVNLVVSYTIQILSSPKVQILPKKLPIPP